ncbi:SpoIID/LytB domain-containing protein [candidate division KSB1 bacterium]|nr:SpoIID/LytB domain-containing protein [candidate division KSB1 bacterium]
MTKYIILFFIVLLIFILQCAVPPPLRERPRFEERFKPPAREIPEVQIGIAEGLESIQLEVDGKIEIFDRRSVVAKKVAREQQWTVRIEKTKPARIKYRLRYKEVNDQNVADKIFEKFLAQGLPMLVERIKTKQFRNNKLDWFSSYSIFLEPKFETEKDAYDYQWRIRDKIKAIALPFIKTPPSGKIILTDKETGESFASSGMLRILGDVFTLNIKTGEGFHFSNNETRKYHGQLDFIIDRFGKLTVVNVLPFETYLMGVVGSEMQEKFPLEALKAQAVTARSYSLARIGKQHRLSPFDLCDEVHCHVYGGMDRESPQVKQAVLETSGSILIHENKICDTFYAGVCGGHTENNEYVWNGEPRPYLRGRVDADVSNFSDSFLQDEKNVRLWIKSSPKVFCNTQKGTVPDYLEYTTKYFRWQVRYSQKEISSIIRKKTSENIGRLLSIIPVSRGVSGRLTEIKIRGTRKTITVEKELAIRKTLSENYLYSSCFVVDRDGDDFIFKGAGWGHGVGMCQTGAANMALAGKDFKFILNHYYKDADIVKIY